jgi:hypothetical protein
MTRLPWVGEAHADDLSEFFDFTLTPSQFKTSAAP